MSLVTTSHILPTTPARQSHALDAPNDRADVIESSFRSVASVLGAPPMSARLSVLDAAGHLRLLSERNGLDDVGRKRSARRREVIAARQPSVVHLRRPMGAALAILPLVSRGDVLGLLEVVAPTHAIRQHVQALVSVADETAIALRNVGVIEDARRISDTVADTTSLMHELLASSSQEEAVRIVVRFCWQHVGTPAAGWLRVGPGAGFRLVASRGIGREAKRALERSDVEMATADAIVRWGSDVLGGAEPVVTRAADAVVLVTGTPHRVGSLLQTVGAGLSLALDRLALSVTLAELTGSVDAGLAWTAHEFRAPLLGVEAAIDRVAAGGHVSERDRQLLERAQVDLRRLTSTVDELLRWSVGAAPIRRRPTDLVRLVSETTASLESDTGGRRVSVRGPERAVVRVDPLLFRTAVENLVRNSLEHGGDDVAVTVELTAHDATVSVSDAGPGVPPDERTAIFDPFARGRRVRRGGRGLGLVIAQRAVQAHGGVLWLEDGSLGSVFRLRVPLGAA